MTVRELELTRPLSITSDFRVACFQFTVQQSIQTVGDHSQSTWRLIRRVWQRIHTTRYMQTLLYEYKCIGLYCLYCIAQMHASMKYNRFLIESRSPYCHLHFIGLMYDLIKEQQKTWLQSKFFRKMHFGWFRHFTKCNSNVLILTIPQTSQHRKLAHRVQSPMICVIKCLWGDEAHITWEQIQFVDSQWRCEFQHTHECQFFSLTPTNCPENWSLDFGSAHSNQVYSSCHFHYILMKDQQD